MTLLRVAHRYSFTVHPGRTHMRRGQLAQTGPSLKKDWRFWSRPADRRSENRFIFFSGVVHRTTPSFLLSRPARPSQIRPVDGGIPHYYRPSILRPVPARSD